MNARLIDKWWPQPWWWGPVRLMGALLTLLALGCTAWAVESQIDEMRVIAELKQGGHMIYLRHADRVRGPRENLSRWSTAAEFADCRKQRNLTPTGREQARQLGRHWRMLGIPVGRVIANGQCRTRDTAILAFGRAEVDPRLYDLDFVRSFLLQPPSKGVNTIIVSSDFSLRDLTGVDLGFAEAAVVAPDGQGGIKVIARLSLDDWEDAADPSWWDQF